MDLKGSGEYHTPIPDKCTPLHPPLLRKEWSLIDQLHSALQYGGERISQITSQFWPTFNEVCLAHWTLVVEVEPFFEAPAMEVVPTGCDFGWLDHVQITDGADVVEQA